jgi:hypothetical protein
MIDYNNIQHIFGDPLNDFGQAEKQGTSNAIKIGFAIIGLFALGYFCKKYFDERYEKKRWVE